MALAAQCLDRLPCRTWVLLGDSEMAEGSQWEAIQVAAHYGLDSLVAVLDVNRLGQRGETLYGHDTAAYERRVAAFGWETVVVDGHDVSQHSVRSLRRQIGLVTQDAVVFSGTVLLPGEDGYEEARRILVQLEQTERMVERVGSGDGFRTCPGPQRPDDAIAQFQQAVASSEGGVLFTARIRLRRLLT